MKKISIVWLIGLLMAHVGYGQTIANIGQYLKGTKVSSITFNNKGIGVATTLDQGFFYSFDNGKNWTQDSNLKDYRINQVVADVSGTFWLATTGIATSGRSATSGGIKSVTFDVNKRMTINHFFPQTKNGVKTGIPSRYVESIASEPSGAVFSAHNYDALTATGPVVCDTYTDPNGIQVSTNCRSDVDKLFNGGGLGMKTNGQSNFSEIPLVTNIYQTNDITCYPRGCSSVLANNDEVWIAINNFAQTDPLTNCIVNVPSQILTYTNTNGKLALKSRITNQNTPSLPLGTNRVFAMHYAKNRHWLGFNANKGFAVYENKVWNYFPSISTCGGSNYSPTVNPNAIFSDGKTGKVFIGTTQGLIIFSGGDITDNNQYTVFNKSNGLPNENVLGGWARNDSVFVTTTDGLYFFQLKKTIRVYNVKTSNGVDFARKILIKSFDVACSSKPVVRVAADSSRSTLFAIPKRKGSNGIKVWISQDPDRKDADTYGYASIVPTDKDSIFILYKHPLFKDKITLADIEIRESVVGQSLEFIDLIPFEISLPPILLVHGVWSNSDWAWGFAKNENPNLKYPFSGARPDATDGLYNALLEAGYFKYMISKKDHHQWFGNGIKTVEKTIEQLSQEYTIENQIDELIKTCNEAGLSAGKVDLIAHSRGGLLSRTYLQSDGYRNDVNKIITCATPHFGAQGGNLCFDNRIIRLLPDCYGIGCKDSEDLGINSILVSTLKGLILGDEDDINGAYDLRSCSNSTVGNLNTSENIKKSQIPSHAICAINTFEKQSTLDNTISTKSLTKSIFVKAFFMGVLLGPAYDVFRYKDVDNFLKSVNYGGIYDTYEGKNDLLVSVISGLGGLQPNKTATIIKENASHSDALKHNGIAQWVNLNNARGLLFLKETNDKILELLRAKSTNEQLFSNGFKNPYGTNNPITYNFLYSYISSLPMYVKPIGATGAECEGKGQYVDAAYRSKFESSRIGVVEEQKQLLTKIDSSRIVVIKNLPKTVKAGSTINFTVACGSKVKKMLVSIEGKNIEVHSQLVLQENNKRITFNVPKEATGKLSIQLLGTDEQVSVITQDTASINVGLPDGVILKGIKILNGAELSVKKGESFPVKVIGVYSDTLRYLPDSARVQYSSSSSNIKFTNSQLQGVKVGNDLLIAKWLGKADTSSVEIVENHLDYITILSSLTAIQQSGKINLSLLSRTEYKTRTIEFQRKTENGIFQKISTIAAKGKPYEYQLIDTPTSGNFTYRAVAMDSLGRSFFSPEFNLTVVVAPVKTIITNFKASIATNKVDLSWSTTQEFKNQGFEVWRGTDSTKLVKVSTMLIKGVGTLTTQTDSYKYSDENSPVNKVYYYQIRAIDESGFISLSKVLQVNLLITSTDQLVDNSTVLYPNPVDNLLTCECPKDARVIEIYSIDGRRITIQQVLEGSNLVLDVSKLLQGAYVYVIKNKSDMVIHYGKFVKK